MDALTQALVETLPHDFLRTLTSGSSQVYAEAWARTYGDPILGNSPESHDLIGQEQHFLYEAHLSRTALAYGIECPAVANAAGTSFHREAKIGRFLLSASRVGGPAERPRSARHRQQNSEVNGFLPQTIPFDFMSESEARAVERAVNKPKPIYILVLHGPSRIDLKDVGFNVIAVPSDDGSRFLLRVSVERLIQLQLDAAAGPQSEQIDDKATPRRRSKEHEG